jgi:hypothetical protein
MTQTRRLAAILAAGVVGYSRLMGRGGHLGIPESWLAAGRMGAI